MVAISIIINQVVMLEAIIQRIKEGAGNEEQDAQKYKFLQRPWRMLKEPTSAARALGVA